MKKLPLGFSWLCLVLCKYVVAFANSNCQGYPCFLCTVSLGIPNFCRKDTAIQPTKVQPTFAQLPMWSCGLDVTFVVDTSSTNRTRLTFYFIHSRPVEEIPKTANTCMCLEGISENAEDNFRLTFYGGNCSASRGICPSDDLSAMCHCNASSCACVEGDQGSTPSQQSKDECTLSFSAVDFGTYITNIGRICYPTSGFGPFPCTHQTQEGTCTVTYWVFCICEEDRNPFLCDCHSEESTFTPCQTQFPRNYTEKMVLESTNGTRTQGKFSNGSIVGIAIAVAVIFILIVMGFLKMRGDIGQSTLKIQTNEVQRTTRTTTQIPSHAYTVRIGNKFISPSLNENYETPVPYAESARYYEEVLEGASQPIDSGRNPAAEEYAYAQDERTDDYRRNVCRLPSTEAKAVYINGKLVEQHCR